MLFRSLDHRLLHAMARINNRAFVGLPSCMPLLPSSPVQKFMSLSEGRNKEYLGYVEQFALDVARDRFIGINNLIPSFMVT